MDPVLRATLVEGGIFNHIDIDAVEHLLDDCGHRVLSVGETLLTPGTENQLLYVVLRGELRVYLSSDEAPPHSVVGVGECVGEMSLIDGQGVSALVIAAVDTEVLVVPQSVLWTLIDRSHGFARNLLVTLSGRMRRDNLTLVATPASSLEFEPAISVDSLTGLHNRRWMTDAFPRSLRRCEQDGAPLCLVLADIDHFKRINDEHGHLLGDTVLRAVAGRLADSLRSPDLIARYGGEQFAILLPQTATDEGLRIAERLRLSVEQMSLAKLTASAVDRLTISCGVAPLALDSTLETLVEAADHALHQAKARGRNRVEAAS